MGHLHYANLDSFEFDDSFLTHLRTVTLAKFALQESFAFTWIAEERQRTIWLHPSVPLLFEFSESRTTDLNHEWVEHLLNLANSPAGLRCGEEANPSRAEASPGA